LKCFVKNENVCASVKNVIEPKQDFISTTHEENMLHSKKIVTQKSDINQ